MRLTVRDVFEFNPYHVLLLAIGASVVNSYWFPRFIPGWEPAASALLIASGAVAYTFLPGMPPILDPLKEPFFWEITSEFAVIVALFGAGIRIDTRFTRALMAPTVRLLAVAMPLTILAVALTSWLFAGLGIAAAILLGAVLAPTDPVLAGDLQVGPPQAGNEHPVRLTLTTEAGLNDGLAFPFVYLAIISANLGFTPQEWGFDWLLRDVVYRIAIGVCGGFVGGLVLARIVFSVPRSNPIARTGAGVIAFAAVVLCYGSTEFVEGYGFIAVFVCGLAFRRFEPEHAYHRRLHEFVEPLEYALTAVMLFLLGGSLIGLLPFLDWQLVTLAVLMIFVFRPLAGWVSLIGTSIQGRERNDVAFFGVRGVGSIYYMAFASLHAEFAEADRLWATTALVIVLSTIVHGLTAGIVVKRYTDGPPLPPPTAK